uniref:DUF4283 domain-containing protein n=1 Tax=Kalanchoe fedtschenkoi TaxID=63787 RepID=A0A7N0TNJ5_KALFE
MTKTIVYSKQLQHALVTKFSLGRPHVSIVEKEIRLAWRLNGPLMISDLDGRHIMLILSSEKDITTVLTQGPRKVRTSLFCLFCWTLEFHFRRESTVISTCIRFPHLRLYLFNEGAL